jgi:hypothetical protein
MQTVTLNAPHWHALYFFVGGAVLIVVGLSVTVLTGMSATSDRVFAIEALLSGLITEQIFRRAFRRRLMFLEKPPIPFLLSWVLICAYVFLFRPFE